MKIGIVSGGFDPIHSGHIRYIQSAKQKCDFLIVGVNTDSWLQRKKGKSFMSYKERRAIVAALHDVNCVLEFDDFDDTAFDLIERAAIMFPDSRLIFMNGGDRTDDNIPEMDMAEEAAFDVEFMFGVGGNDKANSSSWILEDWKSPKTERPWGWYRVLDRGKNWAVKELTILPGESLSDQRHFHRSEHWHVVSGEVTCDLEWMGDKQTIKVGSKNSLDIGVKVWHKPYNTGTEPAKIVETWFGDVLEESDIERRDE